MSTQKPIPIVKILERVSVSEHARLALQIRQHAELEKKILSLLPVDLAPHCRVAGLTDGQLRLTTTNPAWAARLRFQSARLVQQLKSQGAVTVRTVLVRIVPASTTRRVPQSSLRLSPDNARLLEQTASAIQDPGLSAALNRLARHARKRGTT